MAKQCAITGKGSLFGNRRSHANNKTPRKFKANLQRKLFFYPPLSQYIPLVVSAHGMRTISKHGLVTALRKAQAAGVLPHDLELLLSSTQEPRA